MTAFAPSPEIQHAIDSVLQKYPTKMAACIPVLHLCQDAVGWCSPEVIEWVAKRLELPAAHVQGVVTFYTLFFQKPVGKHVIWVCQTLPCALRGAEGVLEHLQSKLKIKVGETSSDNLFTLKTAECLASCDSAPMIQIDKEYFEHLTNERIDEILGQFRAKENPS
jgi:NADH-quinone oxidoreductase subunit E